jgi:IS30 family transposase
VIAHELKLATKSIYNWLYQGKIEFSLSELPEHGLRQRRNLDKRSKYNQSLGRSIEQRPIVINQRPLKVLNWQTPYQVMLTNLSKNSD